MHRDEYWYVCDECGGKPPSFNHEWFRDGDEHYLCSTECAVRYLLKRGHHAAK